MHPLLTCLTERHDPALVTLALIICASGAVSAFVLGREAMRSGERHTRWLWEAIAVLATASTIFATHFIAMLAYDPGLPAQYALIPTLLSFMVALALVGAGAMLMTATRKAAGRIAGAALAGAAIPLMHYTGMQALIVQGEMVWDVPLIAASVIAGIALPACAVALSLYGRRRYRPAAPLLLLLAVCLCHFLGMAALGVRFDPRLPPVDHHAGRAILAVLIANAALVTIAAALTALYLALRSRRLLAEEERRLHHFADVAVEGLLICSRAGLIVSANASLEHMCGHDRAELIGQAVATLLPGISLTALPPGIETDATLDAGAHGPIPVRIASKPIFIGRVAHTVLAVRDQRERLRHEADMRHLAHCDMLTGLANRRSFHEHLAARFTARRRADDGFALLTIDLDRFKLVNDTMGHGVGDEVLRRVARRLQRAVRKNDMLARLGGDEFAIVTGEATDLAEVQRLAERVVDLLCRPLIADGHVIDIGGSVGIALYPDDGGTPELLSRSADLALYRAKEEGRCTFRMFEAGMNARMQARRLLEQDLRRAISKQEFDVHYQPQMDAATGRYAGAEALIRWRHPSRGVVPPSEFITLAEETGLINNIGEWVLRRACTEAATWQDDLKLAVNLSPVQLKNPRIVSIVADILAETGMPARRLELEVTETALLNDDGNALTKLTALRDLGIAISMDDFGTGYSSLSYLRRFPFDRIKIDQSFVNQLPTDPDSAAIVCVIAMLGAKLGLKITAEGVETLEQRNFVAAHGCDDVQGFLISEPLPASELNSLFNTQAKDRALAPA